MRILIGKCCRYFGWSLAVSIVMLLVALTSFVTLLRATTSPTGEESDATATTLTMPGLEDIQHVVGGLWDCEDSPWYFSSDESKCTNDRLHSDTQELFDNMQRIILVVVQAVHTKMLVLMNLRLRP